MFATKTMNSFSSCRTNGLKRCLKTLPTRVSCLGIAASTINSAKLGSKRHSRSGSQLLPSPPPNAGFTKLTASATQLHPNITTNAAPAHVAATTALFTISTVITAVLAALMIFFPNWSKTRQILASPWCIAPIAVMYGILLTWSWQPDTFSLILPGNLADGFKGGFNPQFFPSLSGIVTLFSRVATAASLWVHILAINLFAAREIYLDGELF
jgi:hypothetical protein